MEYTKERRRYQYIDILNIAACLCVVFMHCNGIVHTYSDTRPWKESMAVETLAYWAVPVFFMISGATLLGYREKYTTGTFFKKRIVKTVFPFVVWILINLGFKTAAGLMRFEGGVSGFVNMFNNTTTESVYWFFIPLFMVYLAIPVLSLMKDYKKILVYMAAMAFLIYSVYPAVCTFLKIPQNGSVLFPAAGGYMLFVILGYLLSVTEISKKQQIIFYILGISGALLRYESTVIWSAEEGALVKTFWGYMNFPTVFLAAGVFVAIKSIRWETLFKTETSRRAVSAVAGTGFGVYLMHMIVYRILQNVTEIDPCSYTWRFAVPFVIYFICVGAVSIMKKIPVLKHIVP